jgi:periplasmic copper chaperone A
LATLLLTNPAHTHEFKIKDLELVHPWAREPARDVKDVPVYMLLHIRASTLDRVVAASSPFVARGELGAGKAEGGAQLGAILVPADATAERNADRPHILLVGLTEPFEGYQYFPLVLTFERAGRIEMKFMSRNQTKGSTWRKT